MSESSDVKALEKISTEVDDMQLNILLSSQCIKAQAFLVDKLKKQSERQKELCSFINSANLKLKTEIKLAESEFESLNIALQTIKSANVEYKKELLLVKERRVEIEERVRNGIKKYEDLWMVSKTKYENIPFIKKHIEVKNKCQTIQESINILKNEYEKLCIYRTNKICEIQNIDKQRILELAEYLVIERPKFLKIILEKENERNKLKEEIQSLLQDCNIERNTVVESSLQQKADTKILQASNNNWPDLHSSNDNDCLMLPQIQLQSVDLDILSVRLDQIKRVESSMPINKTDSVVQKNPTNKHKTEGLIKNDYVSSYFNIHGKIAENEDNDEQKDFSDRKLIHILEDIKLDKHETCKIVAKLNPDNLKNVNVIRALDDNNIDLIDKSQQNVVQVEEPNKIEEIDLTIENTPSGVLPPTQFMDCSQGTHFENAKQNIDPEGKDIISKKASQEIKKVTFDVKESQGDEIIQTSDDNIQLNTSSESFKQIKEMILKKHNLDLSPQFVYTKNTFQSKSTKDNTANEDNVIKSKFFDEMDTNVNTYKDADNFKGNNQGEVNVINKDSKIAIHAENKEFNDLQGSLKIEQKCSSPKDGQDMTVAGLLFTHGPQGIPDSLNLSMSTAEYEEGDSDFPHGIDSSLLLSPKADVAPTVEDNNNETYSQGIPNFLSGLRKTGMSFFGAKPDNEKPDSNSENQGNNFTFSFNGEDKKNRGGLFSMFR